MSIDRSSSPAASLIGSFVATYIVAGAGLLSLLFVDVGGARGTLIQLLALGVATWAIIRLSRSRHRRSGALRSTELFDPVRDRDGTAVMIRGREAVFGTSEKYRALEQVHLTTWVPVTITTLGILGTFWGIAHSVQGISLDAPGDANERLRAIIDSVKPIVGGMKTAFGTSLVGMGATVILVVVDALQRGIIDRHLNRLREQHEGQTHLVQTEDILLLASPEAQGEAARTLGEAATGLSNAVAGFDASKLGTTLGQVLETVLTREFKPVFGDIRDAISQLSAIKADQGQLLIRQMLDDLKTNVLEPMAKQITAVTETVNNSTAASKAATQAVSTLAGQINGMVTELKTTVDGFKQVQADTMGRLENYSAKLATEQSKFLAESKTVFAEAGQDFKTLGDEVRKSLAEQAGKQQELLDSVHAKFQSMLEQMNKVFGGVSEKVAGTLNAAKQALEDTIHGIPKMLDETRLAGQAQLEKFRTEYQQALKGFFDQQTTLLDESLGRQRDGLAQVVTDLTGAFEKEATHREQLGKSVAEQLEKMERISDVVVRRAEAAAASTQAVFADQIEHLRKARHAHNHAQDRADKLNQELNTSLDGFAKAHREALQQIKGGLDGAFSRFDQDVSEVCNQLAKAANIIAHAERLSAHRADGHS